MRDLVHHRLRVTTRRSDVSLSLSLLLFLFARTAFASGAGAREAVSSCSSSGSETSRERVVQKKRARRKSQRTIEDVESFKVREEKF